MQAARRAVITRSPIAPRAAATASRNSQKQPAAAPRAVVTPTPSPLKAAVTPSPNPWKRPAVPRATVTPSPLHMYRWLRAARRAAAGRLRLPCVLCLTLLRRPTAGQWLLPPACKLSPAPGMRVRKRAARRTSRKVRSAELCLSVSVGPSVKLFPVQ